VSRASLDRASLDSQSVSFNKFQRLIVWLLLSAFYTYVSAAEPHYPKNLTTANEQPETTHKGNDDAGRGNFTAKGSAVVITGVSGSILENIKAYLGIEEKIIPYSALGFPRSDNYIIQKATEALRVMGYYRPQVTLNGDHQQWLLSIEKGDPVTWAGIEIHVSGGGELVSPLMDQINNHPFIIGEPIHHGAYRDFKTKIQSIANEYGFFDFKFIQSQLIIDESTDQGRILWAIDTGVQYRIKAISLEGSFLIQPFLKRYISVSPGEIYNRAKLVASHQKLNRSGFFKSVYLEQDIDRMTQQVSLTFKLEDIDKYQLKTSIGYGTDSGAKFSVNWEDRRLTETGHKYALGYSANQIEETLFAQYRVPLEGEKNAWINRLSYQRVDDDLAETRLTSYESTFQYYINEHWSSQVSFTLASEEIKENRNISQHIDYLVPSLKVVYSSSADPFRAERGWRWQSDLRIGSEHLSDPEFKFIQLEQEAKLVWPATDNWRFIIKGQLGYTAMDDDDFNQFMPTNYRFFSGGDLLVRGYEYQSLTPMDDSGLLLGGKHLFNYSVETDYRFMQDFRWAVFYDEGSAFNDWDNTQLKSSAGVGLRWVTPVGSIRLDYAYALDEPKEWRWHITIGPDL